MIVDKTPVCRHYTPSHCQTWWQLGGTKQSSHCRSSPQCSPSKSRELALAAIELHTCSSLHFCVWDCGMKEHWSVQHGPTLGLHSTPAFNLQLRLFLLPSTFEVVNVTHVLFSQRVESPYIATLLLETLYEHSMTLYPG